MAGRKDPKPLQPPDAADTTATVRLKFRCARPINFHSTRLHDDRGALLAPVPTERATRPDNKRRPTSSPRPLGFFPFYDPHDFYCAQLLYIYIYTYVHKVPRRTTNPPLAVPNVHIRIYTAVAWRLWQIR